ncbi:hypothetical protein [Streptomyces sp. NPDC017520]|uniref:hypothetical protein n=1 Tax=Streptomyces sp. NPDC017520 TaxID=3364998 RepID=UPI0037A642A6
MDPVPESGKAAPAGGKVPAPPRYGPYAAVVRLRCGPALTRPDTTQRQPAAPRPERTGLTPCRYITIDLTVWRKAEEVRQS